MSRLVIGLGHRDRGDDAVGLVVAERLTELGLDAVAWEGSELDLLEVWETHDHVVVVDALVSGSPVGTIRRLAADEVGPHATDLTGGSHGFGLPWLVQLAETLGRLPPRLEIIAIEAGGCELGHPLHPMVAQAADAVVADLVANSSVSVSSRRPRSGPGWRRQPSG